MPLTPGRVTKTSHKYNIYSRSHTPFIDTMYWSFERSESPEFIRIITSGVFRSNRFEEMFDDLTSLSYWRNGVPLLFDHRKLDFADVDPIELMSLADQFVHRNPDFAFTPIAILFANRKSLKIGKRYGAITEDRSQAEVRRFLKERDAIEWIRAYFLSLLVFLDLIFMATIVS